MPEDTCSTLLAKMNIYLNKQTADWPRVLIREALADPVAREAIRRVDAAALAHDVQACTSACRTYWKAILAHKPVAEEVPG
jgi:hypothetical protein